MSGSRSTSSGRLVLALVAALALAPRADAAVALSAEAQQRLGIRTTVLAAHNHSAQVAAFAKVLDPGPLAALESDLDAQIAAAAASGAEAARTAVLAKSGESVARKDAEAAQAQAKGDQAKLTLLRRRIGLEWGPGVARLSDARRIALIRSLSAGQAALVQVDTPNNEGQPGARSVEIDIGDSSVRAEVLGHSRNAEPRLQSSGLICLVSGPKAVLFSIGLIQSARINTSSAVAGVVVPRSAVVRFRGSDWAYVSTPQGFERRLLQAPEPQPDGIFTPSGIAPGEAVVVEGVAGLFAAEQGQPGRGG
jgi:hypothetical protein